MIGRAAILAGEAFVKLGVRDDTKTGLARIQSGFTKVAAGLTAAFAAAGVGSMIGDAVKEASDLTESMNRLRQVFKDATPEAEAFLETVTNELGRSRREVADSLASFQSFFVGLGLSADAASEFSRELTSLTMDFASFNNVSDEDAAQRFIQGLSGSSEVFAKYGINVKAAVVEQRALADTGKESAKELTELEKAVARLNIIRDVMGEQGAIGDAKRTIGDFAGQMKVLQGAIKNAQAEIGAELLPGIAASIGPITEGIKGTVTSVQELIGVLTGEEGLEAAGKSTGDAINLAFGQLNKTLDATKVPLGVIRDLLSQINAITQAMGLGQLGTLDELATNLSPLQQAQIAQRRAVQLDPDTLFNLGLGGGAALLPGVRDTWERALRELEDINRKTQTREEVRIP